MPIYLNDNTYVVAFNALDLYYLAYLILYKHALGYLECTLLQSLGSEEIHMYLGFMIEMSLHCILMMINSPH